MPVGSQSTAMQSVLASGTRVNSDADAEQDLVRNANEAVQLALERRTNATLATDAPAKNGGATTRPTFTDHEQDDGGLANIVNLPPPHPRRTPAATLHALQEWEGYVLAIGATDFTARLVDLTAGSTHEEEEAEIPLAEISDDDADRIRPGSIFRWVIGYERSPAGTRKRVSCIVFRDLPAITKTDLQDGEAWAREIIRSLNL